MEFESVNEFYLSIQEEKYLRSREEVQMSAEGEYARDCSKCYVSEVSCRGVVRFKEEDARVRTKGVQGVNPMS